MMMMTETVIMITVVEMITNETLTTIIKMMFKLGPMCGNSLEMQKKKKKVLTIISPSSGISRSLCLTVPLCATVPSDLKTQLSISLPNGTLLRLHFFVASPTPHAPISQ